MVPLGIHAVWRLLLPAVLCLVPVGSWAQPEAYAGRAEGESAAVAVDTGEALVELRFDREEISIPYPQRDVHLVTQTQASAANGEAPAG